MARYMLNRVGSWLLTLFGAGAISIFCAGFYMLSLGLKDVAFRGSGSSHSVPGWVQHPQART